jgi:hypothetical protein
VPVAKVAPPRVSVARAMVVVNVAVPEMSLVVHLCRVTVRFLPCSLTVLVTTRQVISSICPEFPCGPVAPTGPEFGATPVPDRAIVLAVGSLSLRPIVADRVPAVVGVKRAVIVQLCSNASVRPAHASAVIVKSPASPPASRAPPVTVSAWAPTLVSTSG